MIKVFEAFAGYGSQSIALRNLNIEHEVVAISEIDKYALQAYYSLHDTDIPNVGDISKIKVEDIPKHDLFTYSFPCTDISVAGKQEGIIKGQTRSGLLYECERIIEHCKPKYLLMENVKNLVGKKFKTQFDEWLKYLEGLGYTNYYDVLNAKNYGIPQNRERVFVISILGEHEPYKFTDGIKLEKRLKDLLEDKVDSKYYLSEEIQNRFHLTKVDDGNNNIIGTTAPEFRTIGQRDLVYSQESTMGTLVATDYKQPKQIIEYADRLGGCFDEEKTKHQAGSVWNKEGLCPTLDTMQGGYRQPLITEEIKIEKVGNLECKGWHEIETRVHSTEGLAPTVETRNRAKYIEYKNKEKILISQATKKGYIEMDIDGVCDLSYPNSKTRRGRVQEGGNICPTLTATQQNIVKIEYKDKSIELPCICASRGRNPENPSSRIIGEPTEQRIEINTKGTSNTITTVQKDNYAIEENFRIRKLTPRECFRLMGMNDTDIDKIQETEISNTQQYKMAGNSIVVNVLEEIFRNLFIGQDISKTPSR